jgi:hypothetical protein
MDFEPVWRTLCNHPQTEPRLIGEPAVVLDLVAEGRFVQLRADKTSEAMQPNHYYPIVVKE